jgi:hypothetical protein
MQFNKEKKMNIKSNIRNASIFHVLTVALFAMPVIAAFAQDATTTAIRHGAPSFETTVRNAEVVYVEGNDLVLKLEDGKVEHLVVPSNEKFIVDGRALTVSELMSQSKLTQSIITTTTPRYVKTVRTINGKIWHVNASGNLIVTLPEGGNVQYQLPKHATFKVDGKQKTIFDLKKGMKIEATIVTDDTHTVVDSKKYNVAELPAPETPKFTGMLLFQPVIVAPTPVAVARPAPENTVASAEEPVSVLPKTATELPLIGALGALAAAASLGLGKLRRRIAVR